MSSPYDILRRPLISEKSTLVKETDNRVKVGPTVVFEVAKDSNKAQIRSAVEKVFKVKVVTVRTLIVRGKNTRMGRFTGRKSNWKKAYVTLGVNDSIELFEGV